jgi:hypothetical protein
MKHTTRIVLAIVALLGMGSVSAKTVLTSASDINYSIETTNSSKTDSFKFSLAKTLSDTLAQFTVSSVDYKVKQTGSFVLALFNGKTEVDEVTGLSTGSSYSFTANLLKGINYTLKFTQLYLPQSANVSIAAVPEPETYALMGVGLLGLIASRRRKTLKMAV